MTDLNTTAEAEEALWGALARTEGLVTVINVAGQELGRVRVCASDEHGGHVQDISCQPGSHQGAQELACWYKHLCA